MRKVERQDVRRARLLIRAGDLPAALRMLLALEAVPPIPTHVDPGQIALPLALYYPFRCERLRVTMRVRDCLDRRSRIWPSGGGRGCLRHAECLGCPVGDGHAAGLPYYSPPPSTLAPAVLPPGQRRARDRWMREHETTDGATVDPLVEAAAMTPDDATDWRG
mgnify:FL=1